MDMVMTAMNLQFPNASHFYLSSSPFPVPGFWFCVPPLAIYGVISAFNGPDLT